MPRVRSLRSPRRAVPLVRAAVSASSPINDPVHWRDRAEEVRSLADGIHDLVAKTRILRIAEDYERLAERAVARLRESNAADVAAMSRAGKQIGRSRRGHLEEMTEMAIYRLLKDTTFEPEAVEVMGVAPTRTSWLT
jgi:hypothetical protein